MKTKKNILFEISMYAILVLLAVAIKFEVPFISPIMALIAGVLSIMYFFTFKHWFKDEKNIVLKVVGFVVMAYIPVSYMFAALDYPFARYITAISVISFIIYWIIRFTRKSIKIESILQRIWFICLWLFLTLSAVMTY
jgi:hypothetical protein